MRIPSYAVLVFSTLLLVGVVHGANITIGPTQGYVEYRITLNNQTSTLASFLLNESAQPTGQNGIVLVTANLLSTVRNFTYSRALNTSSFPEVFPYLLGGCISHLRINDCISFCQRHHHHNALWANLLRPA